MQVSHSLVEYFGLKLLRESASSSHFVWGKVSSKSACWIGPAGELGRTMPSLRIPVGLRSEIAA